jgi:hypothetical protein
VYFAQVDMANQLLAQNHSYDEAAQHIVNRSMTKGSMDNVRTVLIAPIGSHCPDCSFR